MKQLYKKRGDFMEILVHLFFISFAINIFIIIYSIFPFIQILLFQDIQGSKLDIKKRQMHE